MEQASGSTRGLDSRTIHARTIPVPAMRSRVVCRHLPSKAPYRQTVQMGAREELLSAARSLTDDGMSLFSPAELIAKARSQGSTYSDSTLRTHIVSVMCGNAPDHHSTKYRDFERVGRALYRLTPVGPTGADPSFTADAAAEAVRPARTERPTATPQVRDTAPVAHDDEWFWEGNVQAAVVTHLAHQGWQIKRVASTSTSEHGVDIEASRDGSTLLVEVKGYPGTTYARGERKGEAKSHSVGAQARTYFSNALLAGLLMRADSPDARVVLAFPEMTTFTNLTRRVIGPLAAAAIEVWIVSEAGVVTEGSPS